MTQWWNTAKAITYTAYIYHSLILAMHALIVFPYMKFILTLVSTSRAIPRTNPDVKKKNQTQIQSQKSCQKIQNLTMKSFNWIHRLLKMYITLKFLQTTLNDTGNYNMYLCFKLPKKNKTKLKSVLSPNKCVCWSVCIWSKYHTFIKRIFHKAIHKRLFVTNARITFQQIK